MFNLMKLFYVSSLLTYKRYFSTKIKHTVLQNSLSKNNLYIPRTPNQEEYVKLLNDNEKKLVVCVSPSGTGKTLFACDTGIKLLKSGDIDKIVISRPLVSVENENVGFLPGNINMKMDAWLEPMIDVFKEYYTKNKVYEMINEEKIKISPLAYLRGKTFKNSYVICDEMQNTTPLQMKMILTRIGDNSKMVILGDIVQKDIKEKSGLEDFIERYKKYTLENNNSSISYIQMNETDILRSNVVKEIINIYDKNDKKIEKNNDCSMYTKDDERIYSKYK